MKVEVVSTGSHGNMNVIDDSIVIDIGVKRALVEPVLSSIDCILVSHRHGDHISLPVLRMIKRKRPALLQNVYVNSNTHEMIRYNDPDLASRIDNVITGHDSFVVNTRKGKYHVATFPLHHDVENQGFILTNESGENLIHATDTSSMVDCPAIAFDNILVEGNWDEDSLLESLLSDNTTTSIRASRNLRHLSIQGLARFVEGHSKPTTKVYQLHMSGEFGLDARKVTVGTLREMLQPVYD